MTDSLTSRRGTANSYRKHPKHGPGLPTAGPRSASGRRPSWGVCYRRTRPPEQGADRCASAPSEQLDRRRRAFQAVRASGRPLALMRPAGGPRRPPCGTLSACHPCRPLQRSAPGAHALGGRSRRPPTPWHLRVPPPPTAPAVGPQRSCAWRAAHAARLNSWHPPGVPLPSGGGRGKQRLQHCEELHPGRLLLRPGELSEPGLVHDQLRARVVERDARRQSLVLPRPPLRGGLPFPSLCPGLLPFFGRFFFARKRWSRSSARAIVMSSMTRLTMTGFSTSLRAPSLSHSSLLADNGLVVAIQLRYADALREGPLDDVRRLRDGDAPLDVVLPLPRRLGNVRDALILCVRR